MTSPQSAKGILEKLVSKCWMQEDGKIYSVLNKREVDLALKSLAELVESERKLFNPNSTYSEGYARAWNSCIDKITSLLKRRVLWTL